MLKKYFIPIFITGIFYLIYSFFILKPTSYQNFSLIDDGEAFLQNNANFCECLINKECKNLGNQLIEKDFGRFRPLRWVMDEIIYLSFGNNPRGIHTFKIIIIGILIVWLLTYLLTVEGVNLPITTFSVLLLISNFSFTENIVRLGTDEPLQLIFLTLSVIIFLYKFNSKKMVLLSTLFLVITLFVKETSLALIPVAIVSLYNNKNKFYIKYLVILSIVILTGIILSKTGVSTFVYSDNYKLTFISAIKSFVWYISYYFKSLAPFSYFVLFLPFIVGKNNSRLINFSLLIILSFTLMMLPWGYHLERYTLIPLFFFAVIIGISLSKINNLIYLKLNNIYLKITYLLTFTVFLSNLYFSGQLQNLIRSVNYQMWYSKFIKYESDQVYALSKLQNENVYINATDTLNNWEVKFEIPINLKYLYHLNTVFINKTPTQYPSSGYVLNNTTLEPMYLNNPNSMVTDSMSYNIPKIDPIKFETDFKKRPLQTIDNIDKYYEFDNYQWKIYKIK